MNRNNELEGQMVSLFGIELTAPDGTQTNYYSGMVDLPWYADGADGYTYTSVYPGQSRPFMSYDSATLTFTVYYQVNCSTDSYNPSTSDFKTFLLPFYTDNPTLQPPYDLTYKVQVILLDNTGATITNKTKLGTVSTPQKVQQDVSLYLPMNYYKDMAITNTMGSLILNSVTQQSQYFVIIWTTYESTTNNPDSEVYPILYYPNNIVDAQLQTPANIVFHPWFWSTSPGSGSNRNLPYPYSQIPNYMNTVGCMALGSAAEYTGITMPDGSTQNITPYNPNGQYQI